MDAPQQSAAQYPRGRKMTRLALLILTAAIAMLSAGLRAQDVGPRSVSSDPTKEIRALETAFDEAIVGSDVSVLDKMTSDDFTFISLNGELHAKAEVLKYVATHASQYEYRKTDDLVVRMHGDAAVVTGRTTETIQENGKDHSDAYRFTHVYVRQQGRWLLAASQPTRVAER
jgi:ketosteroid isomerase-like protein